MMRQLLLIPFLATACLETNVPDSYLNAQQPRGGDEPELTIPGEWTNVVSDLEPALSTCRNLSLVSVSPHEDRWIVGVTSDDGPGELWDTRNGGDSWNPLGPLDESEQLERRPRAVIYDPKDSERFWVTAIYGSQGVFRTDDGGKTFRPLGDVRHNDLVSINFEDSDRKTLLVGRHETPQTAWLSTDSGDTWEGVAANLPDGSGDSNLPLILHSETFLLGVRSYAGFGAIFRTTNSGREWRQVWDDQVREPPMVSGGVIFWATDFYGAPVRSEDEGLSWTQLADSPGGTFVGLTPIEVPGGLIAAATSRGIVVSPDLGDSWEPVTPLLPFEPQVLTYSPIRKVFIVTSNCRQSDEEKSIMTFEWKPADLD